MIVGFSKHCKGGGNGPVHYLTQDVNPDGSARTPLPQVVRVVNSVPSVMTTLTV